MTSPRSQPVSGHTPTPWRVRDDFGGGWIQGSPLEGESYGDRVCNLAKPKRIGVANAAFIVAAVNSYAANQERIRELEAMVDAKDQALHKIDSWSRAYPLKVFPEPDFKRAAELLEAGGITMDAVSASNMRHVVEGVGQIARAALDPGALK